MRDLKYQLLLSKGEKATLEALARETGVSSADIIRQLVLKAAKEHSGIGATHDLPTATLLAN